MPLIPYDDRSAIEDLSHAYSYFVDTGKYSSCPDLFTDDGVWDENCLGIPVASGKKEISDAFGAVRPGDLVYFVHYVTNIWITEYDGVEAHAISYLRGEGCFRNGSAPLILGYYSDIFAKTSDKWLFKQRKLVPFAIPTGWNFPLDVQT